MASMVLLSIAGGLCPLGYWAADWPQGHLGSGFSQGFDIRVYALQAIESVPESEASIQTPQQLREVQSLAGFAG